MAVLSTLGGTDVRVLADPELRGLLLPILRSDYRLLESYQCRPGATVSCPVTVLSGDADPHTTAEEAEAWEQHTSASCSVRVFRGGHFFLNDHLPVVAQLIAGALC